MRELRPAIHPLLETAPAYGAAAARALPMSRTGLITSIGLHLAGVYMVGLIVFRADDLPTAIPSADFVWLDARILPPSAPQADEPRVVEIPVPPPDVETETREPPAELLTPPTRVVEQAPPVVTPIPLEPVVETESPSVLAPSVDFEAESRRAASEVVEQREREGNYLSFSIRDVAPARDRSKNPSRRAYLTVPAPRHRVVRRWGGSVNRVRASAPRSRRSATQCRVVASA